MFNSQELCKHVKAVVDKSLVLEQQFGSDTSTPEQNQEIVQELSAAFLEVCSIVKAAAEAGVHLPEEVETEIGYLFFAAQNSARCNTATIVHALREKIAEKHPDGLLKFVAQAVKDTEAA